MDEGSRERADEPVFKSSQQHNDRETFNDAYTTVVEGPIPSSIDSHSRGSYCTPLGSPPGSPGAEQAPVYLVCPSQPRAGKF